MKDVLRTAFHMSTLSYVVFFLADYVRPGFVSYTFSAHWFLLSTIVFGIFYTLTSPFAEGEEGYLTKSWRFMWRFVFGVVIALIVWQNGDLFGDLRIFVTLVGFFVPWLLVSTLNNLMT